MHVSEFAKRGPKVETKSEPSGNRLTFEFWVPKVIEVDRNVENPLKVAQDAIEARKQAAIAAIGAAFDAQK